ncbi:MAG: hypothetical protein QW756_05800 [Nitrososphaerota archaeon]
MVSKTLVVILAAVTVGLLAFFVTSTQNPPKTDLKADVTIQIPRGASTPPSEWSGGMVFDKSYFNPPLIRVVIGVNSTVGWVNSDEVSHTATSLNVPQGAASFDSGLMKPGSTFVTKLTVAGRYVYFCSVHPWAGGVIEAK